MGDFAAAGWRERAVQRSLRSARERAVSRSERFIATATDILRESGNLDFTVQDLVERSGLSLRSFYQHFASKDELLLAVLEEAIWSYVEELRTQVEALADPLEQLRAYVTGLSGAGAGSDRPASAALSRYLLSLTSAEPSQMARILEPQVALLRHILEAGVAAGQVRRDLPPATLAVLVTHTLSTAMEMTAMGSELTGHALGAEDCWAFCSAAVLAAPGNGAGPLSPQR